MKKSMLVALSALVTGCSSGISGEYGGENCIYEKLTFKGDGAVYVTFMGMEMPAQYSVDGDRVSVTTQNGQGLVFTKNGDTLEAGIMGEKMECKRL